MEILRNLGIRSASRAITFGAALIFCASVSISIGARAAEARTTKSSASKSKKKFDKGLIDSTARDRKPAPVQFNTWPEPEAAAPLMTPRVEEQPAPTPSQQLRELEMPQNVEGRKLYSFRTEGVDIKTALALFARANGLNIVPDLDVTGQVTLDVQSLPLERMLQALLEANDFAWTVQEGLIRVHSRQTRTFIIDYLRMIRTGVGNSSATLSSGSSGGGGQGGGGQGGGGQGGGGGGGGQGGGGQGGGGSGGGGGGGSMSGSAVNLKQDNPVDFWKELEEELAKLVSEQGKANLAVNKTAGIIEVTDRPSVLKRIDRYLASLNGIVHRQVEIEAKLYDVTLRDQFQFGIDWQRLAVAFGGAFTMGGNMIYTAPANGVVPNPTAGIIGNFSNAKTDVTIKALQEQGDVEVISQPRLRVLNNQTALIKVGTDTPFFTKSVTFIPSGGLGSTTAIEQDEYQLVTIGTILSITPQISSNNVITLDVSPVITSLANTRVSPSGTTTAPEIDIKQASSIIRLMDGQTVVLGGLIQTSSVKNSRKVPLISDIPWLGQLFTGRLNSKEKRELVIFLTPRIVRETAMK
ncbi:MAG TPA: secretin N-terminal domain-containing protein [Verrucomicrobiae bacterium]|nr:secretin N-terminal domain-containing protein [Verrucomicrobiae bacterium]